MRLIVNVATALGICSSVLFFSRVIHAESSRHCCESYYYCAVLENETLRLCSAQGTSFPTPYLCNEATGTCEIPGATLESCLGDCDHDDQVTVDEVVRGVTIALGANEYRKCARMDRDASGDITVPEIVESITNALEGCRLRQHCGGGPPGVQGPLCGPPGRSCVVADQGPIAAAGAPGALAVDAQGVAHVLLGNEAPGFAVRYVQRNAAGELKVEDTPLPAALLAMFVDPDASLTVVGPGGTIWLRRNGAWEQSGEDGALVVAGRGQVARDGSGCFHSIAYTRDNFGEDRALGYALNSGMAWSFRYGLGVQRESLGNSTLVLDQAGRPQIAYWGTVPNGWALKWASPPAPVEVALPLDNNFLPDFPLAAAATVGATESAGELHLFANRYHGGNATSYGTEIVDAIRQPDGSWSVVPVAEGSSNEFVFERCGPPPTAGRTCRFSYTYPRPLAALANALGEVRLIFAIHQYTADWKAECFSSSTCVWRGPTRLDSSLMIAWPEGDAFRTATLLNQIDPPSQGFAAAADREGAIHIAYSIAAEPHYLKLIAATPGADLVDAIAVAPTTCVGDCDGSGDVTVDELITAENIALGKADLSICPQCDADQNETVTVDEIIAAVNKALLGCLTATPTPQPGACRDRSDCVPPNSGFCLEPGGFAGCGPTPAPVPTFGQCQDDGDCAVHGDTFICTPVDPRTCQFGLACVPGCTSDGDCSVEQVCGEFHHCAPRSCEVDADCPQLFVCDQVAGAPAPSCMRGRCTSDAECLGGFCVTGECFEGLGTCTLPPQ